MKKFLMATSFALLGLFCVGNKANAAENDTVIKPFAHYEFNDSTNPGKDSSEHGFDLQLKKTSNTPEAFQILEAEDGSKYASFRRDQYPSGDSKGTGAYLYAPQQGSSSYDFSDMISGSYTVSFTFKSDNTINKGDVYALTFGRYTGCLTVTPWRNTIELQLMNLEYAPGETQEEKQAYCEKNKTAITYDTTDWLNLTVSADAKTNLHCVYINGELVHSVTLDGTKLSSSSYDDYTFAIGAQCNIYGNSATQYGNVDVKDVAIYDCALSQTNVAAIIAGNDAVLENETSDSLYVKSIETLDLSTLDLEITDVNTLNTLTKEGLPSKVKATLSNDVERSFPVYWYTSGNKIKGYLQTGAINASLQEVELDYKYVAKFDYDESLVEIKDIKLDNEDYVPSTAITAGSHTLSFKLETKNGAQIESVNNYGIDWEAEDDGTYYIDILDGAIVYISAETVSYKITYMYGDETLGTSKYTKGGNEELKTFEKTGFTFVGWYTDASLTTAFTTLDYNNPADITLYAKFEEIKSNDSSSSSGGCGGAVVSSLLGIGLLTAGLFVSKRKKEE